jgi:hypothetical protein
MSVPNYQDQFEDADDDGSLDIPARLVTPVLCLALDFQSALGYHFAPDVDEEDQRILFHHHELWRGVQIRWHEGAIVVFLGEASVGEPLPLGVSPDPDFTNAIKRVRELCEHRGVKIETDYEYPFGAPKEVCDRVRAIRDQARDDYYNAAADRAA